MKPQTLLVTIGALLLSHACAVQADDRCATLQYSLINDSPAQLREIASRCQSQATADLFYHRARHLELINTYRSLQSVVTLKTARISQTDIGQYRLYMTMVELMAGQAIDDPEQRAGFLNGQYAQFNDLSELRIKGFSRLADRRERKIFSTH